MADLASLVVRLRTDAREFQKGMATAETGITRFTKSISKAQLAFAALRVAIAVKIAKDIFNLGAAAEETASKFETVFGRASDEVDAFVNNFGRAAGLSQSQARDLTATTASIVQGLGFAREESARFSQEILKLSGDLASFNNRDTADVARAVAAALTGEREQIKQLGLVIREADVQQKALALSGKASASALNDQEKALATLVLLQERSGVAVGDLARTSSSAANQAKQLAGNFQSLKEEISAGLLPLFTPVVRGLNQITAASVTTARGLRAIIDRIAQVFSEESKASAAVERIALSVSTIEQAQAGVDAATASYQSRLLLVADIQSRITQQTEGMAQVARDAVIQASGLGSRLERAEAAAAEAKIALEGYSLALRDLKPLETVVGDAPETGPVATALQTLRAELRQTRREFEVFGDVDTAFNQKVASYRTAIATLLQTLDPTSPQVRALVEEFREATHQTDLAADSSGRLRDALREIGAAGAQAVAGLSQFTRGATTSALKQLEEALASARQEFRLFGDRDTLRTEELAAYRAAIIALTASEGENSAAVQRMVEEYRALANEAKTVREQLGAEFVNFATAFGDTLGRALVDGKRAFRDFANFVIAEITRIIARAAIFKTLTAIFGGAPAGSFGAGVLSALGAGSQVATPALTAAQTTRLDLSSFPPAQNPLAAARDGIWLEYLDRSINQGRANGFQMGAA